MAHKTWLSMAGLATSGLALSTLAGFAQDDADAFDIGTVVVSESKRAVRTDTATSVTVIDQAEIDDRQAGTIAELIDSVPGVSLINGATPVGSGINIRGFGSNFTFGTDNKVLIQIDGVTRGAEEFYRNSTQLFTDPTLFREVEVIRGTTGSFEFGSGVVGGVVRLETKDASDFTDGEVGFVFRPLVEFRTNGQGIVRSGLVAWQPTKNVELLFNYTQRTLGVREDGGGVSINPAAKDTDDHSFLAKGKVTFGNDDAHSFEVSYTDARTTQFDVPFESFTAFPDFIGNVDRDVDSTTLAVEYGFNPVGNDLIDFSLQYSFADEQIFLSGVGSIPNPFFPGPPVSIETPCPPFFPNSFICGTFNADQVYETTTVTAKNRAFFTTGALNHNLVAGLEYQFRDRPLPGQAGIGIPEGEKESFSVFLIDEIDVGNWTFTPALRYEDQTVTDTANNVEFSDDALMGGLSARYAFNNGFAVFGSVAYTEVMPIIDDVLAPALMESEKATTYEFGASYDGGDVLIAGDNLAVRGNVYFTELSDVNSFQGVTDVDTMGFELEASYSTLQGYYADFNGQIVDAEETLANGQTRVFRGIAQDTARLTLGRNFANGIDVSWEGVYGAGGRTNNLGEASDYFVSNVRMTVAPQQGVWEGTEVRFSIENVFNRNYRPFLSARRATGRNFIVSLAKEF
ncbi:MAG: TonB-dependent receptor plug domain-containing protein [Pseudomonadota bacterium]